ncbi:1899_t:CDS:2 [Ambispora gerdemannii]|uniref:1899_t:CDS:1 n=1 Tax=Ambispora gerdemannii TaxID=144530 RepID=A0A9N8YNH4_9GLOM|nr:1899_t:CDS:2 [Ambispora gerdemannii]
MSNSDSDDYMSSSFLSEIPDEEKPKTYSERRRQNQFTNLGYNKPRKVLEKELREEGLSKPIDTEENASSPGLKLLRKMGYEKGMKLGKSEGSQALSEPLTVELKQDRLGLGMSTEIKKRKLSRLEENVKRTKIKEDEYVERLRDERIAKRVERQLKAIQRICETLDSKRGIEYNIFWLCDEEKSSIKKLDQFSDEDEPKIKLEEPEEFKLLEISDEDKQKSEFDSLENSQKIERILAYLRDQYFYCFWCGHEYSNIEELTNQCPGATEEDHD